MKNKLLIFSIFLMFITNSVKADSSSLFFVEPSTGNNLGGILNTLPVLGDITSGTDPEGRLILIVQNNSETNIYMFGKIIKAEQNNPPIFKFKNTKFTIDLKNHVLTSESIPASKRSADAYKLTKIFDTLEIERIIDESNEGIRQNLKSQLDDLSVEKDNEINLLKINNDRINVDNENLNSEIESLKNENKALSNDLKLANSNIASITDTFKQEINDIRTAYEESEKQASLQLSKIKSLNEKIKFLETETEDLNSLKNTVQKKETEILEKDSKIATLSSVLTEEKKVNSDLKVSLSNEQKKNTELVDLVSKLETKIVNLESKLDDLDKPTDEKVLSLSVELKNIQSLLNEQASICEKEIEFKDKTIIDNEKLITELNKKNKNFTSINSELKDINGVLENNVAELKQENETIRKTNENLLGKISKSDGGTAFCLSWN